MIRCHPTFAYLLLSSFLFSVHAMQTFWPSAVPLAVRTPYLNAWMYTESTSTTSSNSWPLFWNPAVLGWICYIRVDSKTYTLFGSNNLNNTALGNHSVSAGTLIETELSPTRTTQFIEAGPMHVNVTFLSPIDPSDLVHQSLPFAYMTVEFVSTDGDSHDVQLYSDISGEWLYGGGVSDRAQKITWNSIQTESIIYHQVQLAQPSAFHEFDQQATDGTVYYAMALEPDRNITWQTCGDAACREEFIYQEGVNDKKNDDSFRDINDDYPVFSISVNMGNVASSDGPITWVIGYVRDPSISYTLSDQTITLRPYYTTKYGSIVDALESFVFDYQNSLSRAGSLDAQVYEAASNISSDGKLYDMLSLVTRQAFSSLEITVSAPIGGESDNQSRIFMKDMGFSRRVTPVENLYAALPMFLYYNASLVKPLLVPLLEQQNSSISSFPYAARDLGTIYPQVSGPSLAVEESIEQTGNMLIIALAHAQYSSDMSLLHDYYALLKNWAEHLKQNDNALFPANQVSIDGPTIPSNSTNLALKGISAIQAMAQISRLVGASNDSQEYSETASDFVNTWKSLAMSSGTDPSVLITFDGEPATWTLPYNLYPQILLGFSLFDETFFGKLTDSYGQQIDSADDYIYGLPVDSVYGSGNIAWNAFTAATFTNDTVRAQLLDTLWRYASNNKTKSAPFGVVYNVGTGAYTNGTLSPALGGIFAPLVHSKSIPGPLGSGQSVPGSDNDGGKSHSLNVRAIIGGVIGSVAVLLVLVGLALWLVRHRQSLVITSESSTRIPTPFAPVPAFEPRPPAVLPSEKFWREKGISTGEEALLLRMDGPLSSASHGGGPPSNTPANLNSGSDGLPQDALLGLRSELENLRRVLNVHLEGREPSDLGAPPDYCHILT